ncbi:hypothetical protein HDU67_005010 [Dinochytrium kinnereticum]|nr:hypothetical protein HDU67_005010 [Dinochytrium kinnereticum]
MRREGKRRADIFNGRGKIPTNGTIRRTPSYIESCIRKKYILPAGMTMEEAKILQAAGSASDLARNLMKMQLGRLKQHVKASIQCKQSQEMKGKGKTKRNHLKKSWDDPHTISIEEEQHLLDQVINALQHRHLRSTVLTKSTDTIQACLRRNKFDDTPSMEKYLKLAGFGPNRSWQSLDDNEMMRLHENIKRWREKGLDEWEVRTSGRSQTVFGTEADARRSDLRERWRLQIKGYRANYWGPSDMNEDTFNVRCLKGETEHVLFEAESRV